VVYTPEWVVEIILDKALPRSLSSVSICDPSCGDGAFLSDIVDRICRQAIRSKRDLSGFVETLRSLTGFDIDEFALTACREKLDRKLEEYFDDIRIDWNLHLIDGLDRERWRPWVGRFDCVVGNPPYIRIQHLEGHRRDRMNAGGWASMGGCTDMYMLFFEYGMELLRDGGVMCLITPNSWMKNNAGKPLRDYLKPFDIGLILDFDAHQVFDGVTTYSAITKITKARRSGSTCVGKFRNGRFDLGHRLVDHKGKWICVRNGSASLFSRRKDTALGEIAKIQVGIQTLADNIYILPVESHDGETVVCRHGEREVSLEASLTRSILKASVMQNGADKVNRIAIFPYDEAGELIAEDELKGRYPLAYAWLASHKKTLLSRDKGKERRYKWYEYGRGVGIKTGFGRKILTSGMNKAPNFQLCRDKDSLFYSGYSIKPQGWVDMRKLLDQLNSKFMASYIECASKPFRQGWRSYAKSFIKDFPIDSAEVRK